LKLRDKINLHRPFLSLEGAAFRLGDELVFENTSWVFRRDEHWAVLGANGSGKSLFADALRGRLPLARGELRYYFRPPPGLNPEEAIGHVSFEQRKFEVDGAVVQSRWNSIEEESASRVRDFLSYERVMGVNPFEVTARHDRARPQFERRRGRAAALLRIGPFLDRTLLSLSNGENQRVQLARALCHPLRLLILDEPFAGLDASARDHFHRVLDQLMGTSLRLLLVTTRVEDVPRRVSHLLWVDGCKVSKIERRGRHDGRGTLCARRAVVEPRLLPVAGPSRSSVLHPLPAPARYPLVCLRNVTVRYGDKTILHDLSWTIRAGESWALLGPNGSGKTTLLSLILRDNPQAYTNDVAVFGQRRGAGESIWEIKRRIGWVSPELHLHFNNTAACLDVVASGFRDTIGLFEPATRHQRAAARQWLERFQMQGFARTPLYGLSAGWQRMVLLARALVKRPRLLILDEPCQGLDPAHRELFVRTVDQLIRSEGVTAIFVTHRKDEIPASIKQVLRLTEGRGRIGRF
jgi:molybdate transport system ATP-binding protein